MESECCFHQIIKSYAFDYDSDSDSIAIETSLNGYSHRQPKLSVRVNVSINSSCTPPPRLLWGICPPYQFQGWGISNFAQPRGLAFANPRATPDLLTCQGFLSRSIPILYPESPGFLVSGGTPLLKWKFALPENLGIWSQCACLSSKWK